MNENVSSLIAQYKLKKSSIKRRLRDFSNIHKGGYKKIFPELCFCLLTPQSNARHCDSAIRELADRGLIFKGPAGAIRAILKGKARFHNKKAEYIVGARACFDKGVLKSADTRQARRLLVNSVKGLGYKEASHFLRNIGLGRDIAILDRHILKNLKIYGAIDNIPRSLTPGLYLDIEDRARKFASGINIPLEELDLLFWSKETGSIFK
jgi:N-glycosylase/DNA lyase